MGIYLWEGSIEFNHLSIYYEFFYIPEITQNGFYIPEITVLTVPFKQM